MSHADNPSHIVISKENGIMRLMFNRVEKRNAITMAMYTTMVGALKDAASDASIRVVIVGAQGAHFTAGNDLMDFASSPPAGEDSPVFQFLLAVSEFPKPLIAAVQGKAVGIGATMILHTDYSVVSEDTQFSFPFVHLGLVPEAASTVLLPARVGQAKAQEWLLLGQPFTGPEAVASGFVNACVPLEELSSHAEKIAKAYAALPPESVRLSKQLFRAPQKEFVSSALRREAAVFIERLQSAEAAEAFTAFIEKRPPRF